MLRPRYRSISIHEVQYPEVPLNEHLLHRLLYNCKGWQTVYGLIMRTDEHLEQNDIYRTLPVTLLPSLFPRRKYQEAIDVQQAMNKLQFLVALDYQFMTENLSEIVKVDEFTSKLLDIYKHVMNEGLAQNIFGQIQRCDYMCHKSADDQSYSLKQIEVNSVAIGGTGFSQTLSKLHRITLEDMGMERETIYNHVPENRSFDAVACALSTSWKMYGSVNAVVLMVYELDDPAASEFWLIESLFAEFSRQTIPVEKMSLRADSHRLKLIESSKVLYLDDSIEVAVVYIMGAVIEKDFVSDKDWQCRLMIERSKAVKIPFIGVQLADRKKIQQVLSKPGVLERFLPHNYDRGTVEAIRRTYVGQWGLDREDEETARMVRTAIENPQDYVLKSQKEGGTGTNYFGESVAVQLKRMTKRERSAYILMERMWPLVHQNYLVRPLQDVDFTDVTSELGVFGYLIGDARTGKILENRATGHFLKTKSECVHEAGISKKSGAMDTVFLVD